MKCYLDLLKEINTNGHNVSDRTGVGRRKVFGRQLHFKMADGFPLVTTRKIPIKAIIHELLWFISGSTSVADLRANNVKIWDHWAVREEHITAFTNRHMPDSTDEERQLIADQLKLQCLDDLGPIYGESWRNAPCAVYNPLYPVVRPSDIAPDRLKIINDMYEQNKDTMFKLPNGETLAYGSMLQALHYRGVDQLQELIVKLKTTPYSSRLIINAWIPESIPFESLSPQENVLLGRAALPPCHLLQQYLVLPPLKEGGKPRLSLQLYQRLN